MFPVCRDWPGTVCDWRSHMLPTTSCFGPFVLGICEDASHYGGTGLAESLVQAIGYAEHCIEDDYCAYLEQGDWPEQELQLRWLRMRRERIQDALLPRRREDEYRRRYEDAKAWLEFLANPPVLPVHPDGEDIPF